MTLPTDRPAIERLLAELATYHAPAGQRVDDTILDTIETISKWGQLRRQCS